MDSSLEQTHVVLGECWVDGVCCTHIWRILTYYSLLGVSTITINLEYL